MGFVYAERPNYRIGIRKAIKKQYRKGWGTPVQAKEIKKVWKIDRTTNPPRKIEVEVEVADGKSIS